LTRDDCEHFVPTRDIVDELERLDALQSPKCRRAATRRTPRESTDRD